MIKLCECCEMEITAARLEAVPSATLCTQCQLVQGDVPMVKGYMSWEHKTAPTIIIGPEADILRSYDRKGFHAQLPFNAKENPRLRAYTGNLDISIAIREEKPKEETELESTTFSPSRCHPDKPRVNPRGDCLDCATAWYKNRAKAI